MSEVGKRGLVNKRWSENNPCVELANESYDCIEQNGRKLCGDYFERYRECVKKHVWIQYFLFLNDSERNTR
jgi:hypothetical protein